MDDDNGDTSSNNNVSFPLQIILKQLAEQLEIAQTLQASAVAASANIKQLFATHDAAATVLQAAARGLLARRAQANVSTSARENRVATAAKHDDDDDDKGDDDDDDDDNYDDDNDDDDAHHRQLLTASPDSQDSHAPGRSDGKKDLCSPIIPRRTCGMQINAGTTTLPREEGGLWALAETEGIEETETGTPEATTVNALVKLQATLRSRFARRKTFAAVNARFVQHFDEEFQHPFYVCLETDRSQWNRPFGFGAVATSARTRKQPETAVVAATDENAEEAASSLQVSQNQTAAAIIIQCAVRAARARRRMAELIVFGGLY